MWNLNGKNLLAYLKMRIRMITTRVSTTISTILWKMLMLIYFPSVSLVSRLLFALFSAGFFFVHFRSQPCRTDVCCNVSRWEKGTVGFIVVMIRGEKAGSREKNCQPNYVENPQWRVDGKADQYYGYGDNDPCNKFHSSYKRVGFDIRLVTM